jgi:hypothetical protein
MKAGQFRTGLSPSHLIQVRCQHRFEAQPATLHHSGVNLVLKKLNSDSHKCEEHTSRQKSTAVPKLTAQKRTFHLRIDRIIFPSTTT